MIYLNGHRNDFRVEQLLPAIGWKAVYADEKYPHNCLKEPLVCWALISYANPEDDVERFKEPRAYEIVACSGGDVPEYIEVCETVANFLGTLAPDDDPAKYADSAKTYLEKEKEKSIKK